MLEVEGERTDPDRSASTDSLPPLSPPLVQVRDLAVHFKVQGAAPPAIRMPRDLPDVARVLFSAIVPRPESVLRAVDGVTFHIGEGETLGLVGESGSGKSTTGRALVRLEKPLRGHLEIDGIDVRSARGGILKQLRRRVQMVFQDPYASLNPRMTLGEIVAEPLFALGLERDPARAQERVKELLNRCGLDPRMVHRYPHEFSGGQRQRIAIARALAPGPKLIVADEPVSALDVSIQAQIVNLLAELQRSLGLSMLFIAHDLAVVRHISQRVAVMYLGRIVEVGTTRALFTEPLHPYTRALLSAVPVPDPKVQRRRGLKVVEGDVPSPLSPPRGCPFHPRCPDAKDRCREDAPVIKIGRLDRPFACHVAHGEV